MTAVLHCNKCSGRVFLDRAYSTYGHIELFCLRCGKRWEAHRDTHTAHAFNRLERKRELGHFGYDLTEFVFPERETA